MSRYRANNNNLKDFMLKQLKTLPTILYLDIKKWRCGGLNPKNKLGKGRTRLLNSQGFMCCLGQFSEQCNVSKSDLLEVDYPMNFNINILSRRKFFGKAVSINDDVTTTIRTKIKKLRALLQKYNRTLKIINFKEITNV